MLRRLKMKCSACGHWSRVPVNKVFIEQPSPEPKVRVMIPIYETLEVVRCDKCGKIIAEPKELIRIQKPIVSGVTNGTIEEARKRKTSFQSHGSESNE